MQDQRTVMTNILVDAHASGDTAAVEVVTASNLAKAVAFEESASSNKGRASRSELGYGEPAVASTTGVQAGSRSRDGCLWTHKAFIIHGAPKDFKAAVEATGTNLCFRCQSKLQTALVETRSDRF